MRDRYGDLRMIAPTAARGITSNANIGVMVRLSNSTPGRMLGSARMLSARIFARLRKGAHNFVAQKLARCGSLVFAFPRGKLDCTHGVQIESLAGYLSMIGKLQNACTSAHRNTRRMQILLWRNKVGGVPFGPGSRRVRARSR
jgi:hypothetical protein